MKGVFYDRSLVPEERVLRIKNPIRTKIAINNLPDKLQELHRVELFVVFENPTSSDENGYFNTRLSYRDIGIVCNGQLIGRGPGLPSEVKPRPPLTDGDFILMSPGDIRTKTWLVNLKEHAMLEGAHQYEIFIAGNHTLPSERGRVAKESNYSKTAITVETQSNTVTFTYTKPPKETKTPGNLDPTPSAADKLNDGRESLVPEHFPLKLKITSSSNCPQTGIWECASDAPGITAHRRFIKAGQPMPYGVTQRPSKGFSGFLGSQEDEAVEISWTLVAYDEDAL